MPWWGWIVVGAVLLGAELFVIPTDFYWSSSARRRSRWAPSRGPA
jgi:membrane protein implicated in regulation of membrane protease activity